MVGFPKPQATLSFNQRIILLSIFTISNLVIPLRKVGKEEPVDISAGVGHNRGREGDIAKPSILKEEESSEIILPALTSQRAGFSISRDKPGS